MPIHIPEFALVLLIGPSGCGKSTFARKHFKPTEILSSDFFRGMLSDDEMNQTVSGDAFELLHLVCAKRLAAGRLTVIDATNVRAESRKPFLEMARQYHAQPVAVAFDFGAAFCHARNQNRAAERPFGAHVTKRHADDLKRSLGRLEDEGFRRVYVLKTEDEVNAVTFERYPLPVNKRAERGPFDIVGDVHGCLSELLALLVKLGYRMKRVAEEGREFWRVSHPENRRLVFVGDLCDRGPDTPGVYRLVMDAVQRGVAFSVLGNHDDKLLRWFRTPDKVKLTHGLAQSAEQFEKEPPPVRDRVAGFVAKLPSHLVLDGGRLVVAHAGLTADMHGRVSGKVRAFALYGDTTGESDEFGLPVRLNWAAHYRARASVVYGHTPTLTPEWVNRCICVDTGCVFGGALTALRWPEQELVSVPADKQHAEPKRPLGAQPTPPAPLPEGRGEEKPTPSPSLKGGEQDLRTRKAFGGSEESSRAVTPSLQGGGGGWGVGASSPSDLDLADVIGRRTIDTHFAGRVTVREENAAAALEVMSRFAADPRWLIYLPPTMSPCEASPLPDFLEHPAEAFGYFKQEGVAHVVCEQKHMGSRAVVMVCKDETAASRRFHTSRRGEPAGGGSQRDDESGIVYTRTGRRFFDAPEVEAAFLALVRDALTAADWWTKFNTDWVALDGELMPWSAKAQELLRRQYAATGSAARAALAEVNAALADLARAGGDRTGVAELRARFAAKADAADRFVTAYRQYCWPVNSVADLKFAPFFVLATEGKHYFDRTHEWHMRTVAELAAAPPLLATPFRVVDLADAAQVAAATDWWLDLTRAGGEGMVVKPLDVLTRGRRFYAQPALKVRGREYLRIIYGPDYLSPEHLVRLKHRAVGAKRGLAAREFGLGLEGLDRFARGAPLREVHECVFAVLALESEPIDPRL
ncbi:AAA family ATPase [Frigoriglobus tundricola]|uniref:Phosphatase n=1 Tax=Frigoriglobus tundricola TaxID=2774151 RepID=A0A6M5YQP6_9BACT|nr:AAA family ATPase [Frigoriglobus tundricola]QJW95740.1 Putative phosphatase [Frigoriglobus tundricola]